MRPNPEPGRSRIRHDSAWVRVPLAFAAAAAVVVLAGCSSSKPAYCTDRTNLQDSVKGLTSAGVSGLKTQIGKIQTNATAVVNSAKGDFPNETSAITSSVEGLKTSLSGLPSSPSAAQIATVASSAASVVTSVKNFVDASNSKCS